MPAGDARRLADLLGLDDDELCEALGASALDVVSGEADSLAAVPILLDLLADAEQQAGAPLLRRWVRASGASGVPIELLCRRDYAGFEDALADLSRRGFILRRR